MPSAKWQPFCSCLNVLTHWSVVMPYGIRDLCQNWSVHVMAYCLMAPKPLHEPMLTNHWWGLVELTWGQFHRRCSRYLSLIWVWKLLFNSSPPSATYIRQWIGSTLVQIMACCCLFGAKPLSESILVMPNNHGYKAVVLGYCQLDPWEQTSVKFQSNYKTFHSRKCIWKHCLWEGAILFRGDELRWQPYLPGDNELTLQVLAIYRYGELRWQPYLPGDNELTLQVLAIYRYGELRWQPYLPGDNELTLQVLAIYRYGELRWQPYLPGDNELTLQVLAIYRYGPKFV